MRKNTSSFISVSEAAGLMSVFPTYVLTLIYGGKLKAVKNGNRWRVDRQDAERYAARLKARRRGILAGERQIA